MSLARRILLPLLAGLLAFATGCRSVNTVQRQEPVNVAEAMDSRIDLTDSTLNKKIRLVAVQQAVAPGGFLKVQVIVLNTTSFATNASYKFEWLDASGMLIQSPAPVWKSIRLLSKEEGAIIAVAPTEAAKDFHLKLIEAK